MNLVNMNWKFKASGIALQDKSWNYWHLGRIKANGYTVQVLAESYRNFFYCLEDKSSISIQIPSICKTVAKRIEEINLFFGVGKVTSIGLFPSFSTLRVGAFYDGKVRVMKVESLDEVIPLLPELECEGFPEGREQYVKNSQLVRDTILAKFNF